MRIIVTGVAGKLGNQLANILARQHEVIRANKSLLDVTDFKSSRTFVASVKPDLVLHTAAWTDVDGCARDPQKAITVNGFGTQNIALAAAEIGASVLYISTNEVFDGRKKHPYLEYDRANPINPYGYSKFVGEDALFHVNPKHYIVRTAWLFAHDGHNFIQEILRRAQSGQALRAVTDEIANPTYNNDLAEAIMALVETERYGIYHFVNEGECSRYDFARYVLDISGYNDISITPIKSAEWQRASTPPIYSSLKNSAGQQIGITFRHWQEAVDAFVKNEDILHNRQ